MNIALFTWASCGIGRATVILLAQKGWRVAIHDARRTDDALIVHPARVDEQANHHIMSA